MTTFHRDRDDDKRGSGRGPSGGRGPQLPAPPSRPFRTAAFWVLVVLLALVAYKMYSGNLLVAQRVNVDQSVFIQELDRGNVDNASFAEQTRTLTGDFKTEVKQTIAGRVVSVKAFKTNFLGDGSTLADKVRATGARVSVNPPGVDWMSMVFSWLPLVLFLVVWMFVLRQMQGGGSAALKFGKTKARVLMEPQSKVTFKDVAGCDEAKQELQEIIEFLKEPQKFQRLGGRIPKGALLLGPPGSGKTLLARAVAGEAGVPFFSMSGSDFVEMFVGVGASVTGDTPVLVRHQGRTQLQPIGEFVDRFYDDDKEGFVVKVDGLETLGYEELDSKFKGSSKTFVQGSAWKGARGVYRHRVSEIYEIRFLGGAVRTTGDHSVFVRTRDGIKAVEARELKPGDVLVQLPMKVRGEYTPAHGTPHTTRAHAFMASQDTRIPVLDSIEDAQAAYAFVTTSDGGASQAELGAQVGVSQMTVSNWQRGQHQPRAIATRAAHSHLPEDVALTPLLMKLFGYYTAEGRENGCLEFTFGSHEIDLHAEVIDGLRAIFGVEASVRATEDNSTKLTVHSAALGRFFERHCGTGSHEKHVPEFLWDLPREYFEAYLTGWALGDGYVSKEGKLSVTSVSHRLIREMTWLCAMHGIPAGVRETHMAAGRVIKHKPLPATTAWNLIIGKTSHWLVRDRARQGKRAIVREVVRMPFEGYVYDLCGCDNEAFFGGEKPLLLHNSRVRDLFEQAKRNAPCLTGDSVVTLSGGREVTIREMYENNMVGARVPAMADDFRFGEATVIHITCKPSTDLFELRTSTSSVKATGNHQFPAWRDGGLKWVRTDELAEGDYVAMPRMLPTSMARRQLASWLPGSNERRLGDGPGFGSRATAVVAAKPECAPGRVALAEPELVLDLGHEAVLWTHVESITPLAAGEPVYDLCLDRYHNFIASHLFTHNCIVFVDEIDAVGRHRGAGLGGGHDEREQTLNQLLVEMDGFESNEGVIMIAATNRPDVLDPALLRPGRFDRQVVVDWPDVRGREGILKVHTRKIPLAEDVDLKSIARSTPGMSGAELANIVNEAALLAARRNHKKVSDRDLEDAKDKVMMGAERRSLVMSEEERKTTAFHEAGHALVAWLIPGSDPVTKVTIIPRGRALGVTFYTPQEERHNHSKRQLEDRLCHAMGGRAAEKLTFDHYTTGAANDLEQATGLARSMVTRFGMSDKLGPLTFGKKDEMVFLGRELSTHKDYSEQTAVLIDQEVREMVERAHEKAVNLLKANMDKLALLANTLLERETIDGDEMDRVLRGEKLEPVQRDDDPSPDAPVAPAAPATSDEGAQLDAFGGPAPRPAGA